MPRKRNKTSDRSGLGVESSGRRLANDSPCIEFARPAGNVCVLRDGRRMTDSITTWILALKAGRDEALQPLWDRYFDRVAAAARKRMAGAPRRAADEEDVALSVFASLCRGINEGRFDKLRDRDDLWRLLLGITRQKVIDRIRHEMRHKRGGGQVSGESVFFTPVTSGDRVGLDAFAAAEPTPEDLALIDEEARLLMEQLPENLRQFARLRLEGYENSEIARELDVSLRTVERKLQLIRSKWIKLLDESSAS